MILEEDNKLKLSDSDIALLKKWGETDEDIQQIERALNVTVYKVADVIRDKKGNIVIPDEDDDVVITAQEAREILGDETFLSGLDRSAFHWISGRYNADETKYVGFNSSALFKSDLHDILYDEAKSIKIESRSNNEIEAELENLLLHKRFSDLKDVEKHLEENGIKISSHFAEDGSDLGEQDPDFTPDDHYIGNIIVDGLGYDVEFYVIPTNEHKLYVTEVTVLEQYDECLTEAKERFTCPECGKDINELFECDGKFECTECGHIGDIQSFRECNLKEDKEKVEEAKLNFIENVDELPDMCYGVLPSDNSIIIIQKGETGYYTTDYSDMVEGETYDERHKSADEIVNRLNAEIDITPDQRFTMEIRSMNGNWKTNKKEEKQLNEAKAGAEDVEEAILNAVENVCKEFNLPVERYVNLEMNNAVKFKVDDDTYYVQVEELYDIDESKKEERNLTRAERHNRNMDRIFDTYNQQIARFCEFLKRCGYTDEEIEKARQNTGLSAHELWDLAQPEAEKLGPDVWGKLCNLAVDMDEILPAK